MAVRSGLMRAIVVAEHGGPDVLSVTRTPAPRPAPGEVIVDVAAAGVNFIDIYQRSGAYPTPLPFIAGNEAVGTVREDGSGFRAGERVGWVNVPGAYAECAAVPADRLIRIPDEIDAPTAAAVLLQGMTAHYLAHDTYPVRRGDTVLIHAAAGGVGLLLTQVVKLLGGVVIGTVSNPAKERAARKAGADHVIRYTETDVAARVRELTGGAGVAAVYDGVGGPTFDASLASVRPRGVLAVFGQAGGPVPPVDPQRLNAAGSVFLTRPNLAHHVATSEDLRCRSGELLGWVAAGRIVLGGRTTFPLADAAAAHTMLETRESVGKLVLLTS